MDFELFGKVLSNEDDYFKIKFSIGTYKDILTNQDINKCFEVFYEIYIKEYVHRENFNSVCKLIIYSDGLNTKIETPYISVSNFTSHLIGNYNENNYYYYKILHHNKFVIMLG